MEANIIQLHPSNIQRELMIQLTAGNVPMLWGSPGISKSAQYQQLADKLNLKFIDLRLSQMEPGDLNGYPMVIDGRMVFVPTKLIPLIDDPIPEGYDGWLVLFDEINHASTDVYAASQKVLLDRMVGDNPIHPKAYLCAAGNLDTDRAGAKKMPTSVGSRIVHYFTFADLDQYLDDFATQIDPETGTTNIDERIIAFLLWDRSMFYNFDPNTAEKTFACNRTYEFLSKAIRSLPDDKISRETCAACIGTGAGVTFHTYVQNRMVLPTIEQVIADPKGCPAPDKPDLWHTMFSGMTVAATQDNMSAFIQYAERAPMDFQQFFMQTISKRAKKQPELLMVPEAAIWVAKFAKEVIA